MNIIEETGLGLFEKSDGLKIESPLDFDAGIKLIHGGRTMLY